MAGLSEGPAWRAPACSGIQVTVGIGWFVVHSPGRCCIVRYVYELDFGIFERHRNERERGGCF